MSGEDDGFLSRWSRRKRAAITDRDEAAAVSEELAADVAGDSAEADLPEAEGVEELSDAEILEKFSLKDPDELGPGDDFSGFMRSAIPDHLRRRALRTLWRSNPVLANLDGLNDYDGDWTGGSVPSGQLKTAYEVGVGFVRGLAQASEKLESVADLGASHDDDEVKEAPAAIAEAVSEPVPADVENAVTDGVEADEIPENHRLGARKKMIFRVS